MKKLLIILLLLIGKASYAQTDSLALYSLSQLDSIYNQQKNNKEQLATALAMLEKSKLDAQLPDTTRAKILYRLGFNYLGLRDYANAESFLLQAIELLKNQQTPNFAHSKALTNLGLMYRQKGDYEKALPMLTEAENICKKTMGSEHIEYANILHTIANCHQSMGMYKEAEDYYLRSLEIKKKTIGIETEEYASSLNNLGGLYRNMGAHEKALPMLTQSAEIRKKILGEQHPDYAQCLSNMAAVYNDLGLKDKALPLVLYVVDVYKKNFGEESTKYIFALNMLAGIYKSIEKYEDCKTLILKVIELRKKLLGEDHPDYAQSLMNLASIYKIEKQYDKALPLHLQSIEIKKKKLREEHPDLILSYNNLANLYKDMGRYEDALPLYMKVIEIRKKNLGVLSDEYLLTVRNLINLYKLMGDTLKLESYYGHLFPIQLSRLDRMGGLFGEKEKQILFSQQSYTLNDFNAFAATSRSHDSMLVWVQNGLLLSKAFALAGVSELLPLIQSLNDSSLNTAYTKWIDLKKELGKAYEMTIAERQEKKISIDSLEQLAAQEEAFLMQQSAVLKERLGYNKKRFYYKDLQAAIAKNELVIDFVRFENEQADTAWYYALVNQQGWAFPKYIPLCTEAQLMVYAQAEISPDKESYITNAKKSKELYTLIIKPLEPYLKKIKTVHWSPVGLLNQVAMGTLLDDKDKMFSQKFTIHQYGSLKDFVIKKTADGSTGSIERKNVLLVGDVAFDLNENEHQNLAENSKNNNFYASRAVPTDSTRGGSRFVRLEGTKVEVENLKTAFSSKKWQIEQLQQKEALEEKVREYSGEKAPSVLHFATHGFFIPAKKEGEDNPLLRSGIALAGANRVWLGKPRIEGVEDGLWTAYEVANTNLLNTNLVVLSACETARGYIDPHEGVVGLQRAFKIAGADNMLLSLWQVPDKETVELMQEFYKYYLNGESPAQALHKAQDAMRKQHPEPYYWAAFVLIE